MSVQRALSKSSLMALKASRESCFKPVYCSELWLHVGSALQCSACNPYPSGRSNITETSAPTPWECGGWQGTAALHGCHLPEVPWGCPESLLLSAGVQGGLLTQPPWGSAVPSWCHTLAFPVSVGWPCPSKGSDGTVAGSLGSWVQQQEIACLVPIFPLVLGPGHGCVWGVAVSAHGSPSQHTQLSNISITCRIHQQQFEQLPVGLVSFLQGFSVLIWLHWGEAWGGTWAPPPPLPMV